MNTATPISNYFSSRKNSTVNMEQRGFYFVAGVSSFIAAILNPMESMFWLVTLNVLGTGLIMLAAFGKHLFAARKFDRSTAPTKVTCLATGIAGIGLSVAAIATPPASSFLAFYLYTLTILMVTHTLLNSDSFLGRKIIAPVDTLPTDQNPGNDLVAPLLKAA